MAENVGLQGFDGRDGREQGKNAQPAVTHGVTQGDHLYVIQAANGYIKIGRSKNPPFRLREIQTASAVSLRLVHVVPNGGATEKQIHEKLKDWRQKGEWFNSRRGFIQALRDALGFPISLPYSSTEKMCETDRASKRADEIAAAALNRIKVDGAKRAARKLHSKISFNDWLAMRAPHGPGHDKLTGACGGSRKDAP